MCIRDSPRAGLHLWLPCSAGWISSALTARALDLGIVIGDGTFAFADEAPAEHVRMSFGAVTEATAEAAVQRLASSLDQAP